MLRRLVVAGLWLALVAPSAQAGIFGGGEKLPKPVSFTGGRDTSSHKVAAHLRGQLRRSGPSWGAPWKRIFFSGTRPLKPYLR
jgi:hypothetical protein